MCVNVTVIAETSSIINRPPKNLYSSRDVIIIAKSELFPNLIDISFAQKDPDTITAEILSLYESLTGRTLARADPVRLFLDTIILAVIQQRNLIDHAAKMNLLAYATGEHLDHIGALLGVERLEASPAVTTIRFTLNTPANYDIVIPAGIRVSAGDGITFRTQDETRIPAGTLIADTQAQCTTAGSSGNGYAHGQVNKLVEALPFAVSAENISVTSGGSEVETDEAFRERIRIAPESFSVAGPVEAYRYFARSANSDIIDVAVVGPYNLDDPESPRAGEVRIYPLMTGGTLPSDEVLAEVLKVCSAEDVRPDTDYVSVNTPVPVYYSVNVKYWIDIKDAGYSTLIMSAVQGAVSDWELWQRQKLGRDINPSELIRRVINAGAKRCEVSSPEFCVLKDWEVGMCTSQSVNYGGLEKA